MSMIAANLNNNTSTQATASNQMNNTGAAAATGQTFLTGGGCAVIPGVGSPILMISNAHKFIEDALNIKNTYTNVKYVHFLKSSPSNDPNVSNYRLVFSLTDYNGTKYIAVDLDQSPFGIGSTKINKFLMTSDVARIRQFIDPTFTNRVSFTCGDLKYVYSSYGNDPTANFDYLFPGRNQNSAGLNVLNNLMPSTSTSVSTPVEGNCTTANKVCCTANFIESSNFCKGVLNVTPIDSISCLPSKNAVAQIRVGCVNNTLQSLQLVFNNLNDNGTTPGVYIGNPNVPACSILTIDLNAANRVVFNSSTTPNAISIQTINANGNPIAAINCGTVTATSSPQTLLVNNFLGFGNVLASILGVAAFELVSYNA